MPRFSNHMALLLHLQMLDNYRSLKNTQQNGALAFCSRITCFGNIHNDTAWIKNTNFLKTDCLHLQVEEKVRTLGLISI